jgi:hypothetical protein
MATPLITQQHTQAWLTNVPGATNAAIEALTKGMQNLALNEGNTASLFHDNVVNRFNTPAPKYPQNTPHAVRAFIDLTKYTLQESQKQVFEMAGRWLNSQNDLEIAEHQLTRTTTELTQARAQLHALTQRMPSTRLLGTAAVATFIAGALVTHFTPQIFPSWLSLGESPQNDCSDCEGRLDQLHGEYKKMEELGKDCLDQRRAVGEKLATCAKLLKTAAHS